MELLFALMRIACTHASSRLSDSQSETTEKEKLNMAERKRSIVWTHFTAVNANEATCDLCSKCIRYCGNTTNLTKHLKVNHRKEHDDMERRRVEERERGSAGKTPHTYGPNEADLPLGIPTERQAISRYSENTS